VPGALHQARKQLRNASLVVGLVAVAALVGGYIVARQRVAVPSWVPVIGQSRYVIKAEFQTAQAVAPGQGQIVTVAGVKVGEIERVDLRDGRALVTMGIDRSSGVHVRRDATLLLRPKTGLKDMTVAMDPGSAAQPLLESGATLPVSATQPDVNLDEVLSALDADSRDYLRLLLNGAGTAVGGQGRTLASVLKRFNPTARNLRRITEVLSRRHRHISRAVHDFSLLAGALGARDRQLSGFVDASNAVLATFASEDRSLRATLSLLPGALEHTRAGLGKVTGAAHELGATLRDLEPTARDFGPGLAASGPFLRSTTPIIAGELRPFARAAKPTFDRLRPAASGLVPATRDLRTSFGVLERFLNELAHDPDGGRQGYLFYLEWAAHDLDSIVSMQDANGPLPRGTVLTTCGSRALLDKAAEVNASVRLLVDLLRPPSAQALCGGGS
jgi:phospholipid/cholesterol/gamma-HCH transport system substrate-binding protein